MVATEIGALIFKELVPLCRFPFVVRVPVPLMVVVALEELVKVVILRSESRLMPTTPVAGMLNEAIAKGMSTTELAGPGKVAGKFIVVGMPLLQLELRLQTPPGAPDQFVAAAFAPVAESRHKAARANLDRRRFMEALGARQKTGASLCVRARNDRESEKSVVPAPPIARWCAVRHEMELADATLR